MKRKVISGMLLGVLRMNLGLNADSGLNADTKIPLVGT